MTPIKYESTPLPQAVAHGYDGESNAIHNLSLNIQFPTERKTAEALLRKVWGGTPNSLLISPDGGMVIDNILKSTDSLHTDTSGSGCFVTHGEHRFKSTQEDSQRAYLLQDERFVKELVKDGWFYFPEAEKINDSYKARLGEPEYKSFSHRDISVAMLVKALGVVDTNEQDYAAFIADLSEIGNFSDNISILYETDNSYGDRYLHAKAKMGNTHFGVKLTAKNDFRDKFSELPPMVRSVEYEVPYGQIGDNQPDWWLNSHSRRVNLLVNEYMAANKSPGQAVTADEGIMLELKDRKYESQYQKPQTGQMLEELIGTRDFAISVIAEEHKHEMADFDVVLKERRASLGNSEKKTASEQ